MDVHRCRFVPYPISPVNALAFSHSSSSDPSSDPPSTLRLAVGRANGDIEIWNPHGGLWVQEQILRSGKDRSIEGLAWTQDPDEYDEDGTTTPGKLRLFSIGYSTVITEWDTAAGKPLRHSNGNYGEIWCLSAQPRTPLSSGQGADGAALQSHQKLVAGCADGALIVLSSDDGELTYQHTLPRPSNRKARVLSLAWRNKDTVVAGYSDSAIRVFDVRGRGRLLQTLSLGASTGKGNGTVSNSGRANEILVWSVRCLSDGTVVSGDSMGEIKIWESGTLALLQRLRAHKADVLDLAASADGDVLLSAGIDRRTIVYHRVGSGGPMKQRWAEVSRQRLHTSDVKALTAYEAKGLAVVVSGGLDAQPIAMPLRRMGYENSRRLAVSPNSPPLLSAPEERLIASWWTQEVRLWRVGPASENQSDDGSEDGAGLKHDLVAKIVLQGEENISSCSLANNGSVIVIGTSARTVLFSLEPRPGSTLLKVRKVDIPPVLGNTGCNLVSLSLDAKWLFRVRDGTEAQMFQLQLTNEDGGNIKIDSKVIKLERLQQEPAAFDDANQAYLRSIHRIAWSQDSKAIVACDLSGRFEKWHLQDHIPSINGHHDRERQSSVVTDASSDDEGPQFNSPWRRTGPDLPRLDATPLVLSFSPAVPELQRPTYGSPARHTRAHDDPAPARSHQRLLVVTATHNILEFDTTTGRRTDWSRRNPPSCLPLSFTSIRERAMGCLWSVTPQRRRLWLYGASWLWMLDLNRDLPMGNALVKSKGLVKAGTKRKHDAPEDTDLRQLQNKTAGAGSNIPKKLLYTGMGSTVTIIEDDESKVHALAGEADDEDEMDLDGGEDALLRLRRGISRQEDGMENGDVAEDDVSDEEQDGELDNDEREKKSPASWGTFRYRPILGVVALIGTQSDSELEDDDEGLSSEGEEGRHGPAESRLEVALVERPIWEADLPPRWSGEDR